MEAPPHHGSRPVTPSARSATLLLEAHGIAWESGASDSPRDSSPAGGAASGGKADGAQARVGGAKAERAAARRAAGGRDVRAEDRLATALMELYRSTGSGDAFAALVDLTHDQLMRRVRARTRYLGERVDPQELLQDAYVNMFRYPDRFDGSRPGAFRAWSSTIVDNAVRRHMRRARSGPEVSLRPVEILAQEPSGSLEPGVQAMHSEAWDRAATAFRLLLSLYLAAYQTLSERERFVLQMVEVKGMRYAQLAELLEIRPDALKMVVFRARRRILERVAAQMPLPPEENDDAAAEPAKKHTRAAG